MNYGANNFEKKLSSEKKSCIAWFKLAELISRGEKEKALSLYRLLSHSFDDKAYALQVEGDILWSLEDKGALEKYSQAAFLYKKEKKIVSTAAIYEHLLTLQPDDVKYTKTLLLIYVLLSWPEKFEKKLENFLSLVDRKILEEKEAFHFIKKIIDFAVEDKEFEKKQFAENYDFVFENCKQYTWITKSLVKVMKLKKSKLLDQVQLYCLENNLDFDS